MPRTLSGLPLVSRCVAFLPASTVDLLTPISAIGYVSIIMLRYELD